MYVFLDSIGYPDIILITEHWLKPDECFYVPEYKPICVTCRENSIHGGTLILIKKSASLSGYFTVIDKFNYLIEEKTFEFSLCYCKRLNLYIICLYRSPLGSVKQFLERLDLILSNISSSSRIILAGDLNVNYNDSNSLNTTLLANLLVSYGLDMHVNEPTRITDNSATTIDYLCSNYDNISCSVLNAGISDHEAVSCAFDIDIEGSKQTSGRSPGRIFNTASFNKFYSLCLRVDWQNFNLLSDPVSSFHSVLCDLFNQAFPLRWIKKKSKKKKPWLTTGIKISATNLRSLNYLKKFCDNDSFICYCNKYRSIYRKVIKSAKNAYYNKRLSKSKNKQKESWSIINDLRNKSFRGTPDIDPEYLNRFYCDLASNLTKNLTSSSDPLSYLGNFSISSSFCFFDTDKHEIKEVIREIKNKKSSGDDEVSAEVLLRLPDGVLDALSTAINESWAQGVFPACLKSALVIPLFKGGDSKVPSNFRPISLLPTLSKVIEKLVKKRIWNYLQLFNVITAKQFGFQASKGTHDAIFDFLERVYFGVNRGDASAAVFCDLSKAFDCVDHGILLRKMERYGFRGRALSWFSSYLEGRRQSVVHSGARSSALEINCGVPQGSVLGPILFLIYINDLVRLKISGDFTLFADDTSILWHDREIDHLKQNIISDLLIIKEWCDSNRLCFNLSKTHVVGFKCNVMGSFMAGDLQEKTATKFLGILIDNQLHFEDHIITLSKKLSSGCFAVRAVREELGQDLARTVYFSLFESHLRYGIPFWGTANQGLLNMLFILQKKAVRFIVNISQRESCRPHFQAQRILTLTSLFILETTSLIYKNRVRLQGPAPLHETRQSLNLPLPIPKTALVKRSQIYEGRRIFNHLPSSLRMVGSLQVFRRSLKRLLVNKVYYNIEEFYRF